MHGAGTKPDITRSNPPARLLDVTRLLSRAGRPLTGVDRVERAYLEAVVADPVPAFGLLRSAIGYILLDEAGLTALLHRIDGREPWGAPDRLSRLSRTLDAPRKGAEADMRRVALDRCLPQRLTKMLQRHLPKGTAYLNVGHSNLTERVLFTVKHGLGGRTAVMIHDTIPLDHPDLQTEASVTRFRKLLKRVGGRADVLIYNSEATRASAEAHLAAWGRVPESVVAHLGLTPLRGIAAAPESVPSQPYCIAVGTIEPRKNIGLLLDIWDDTPDLPPLLLCGRRGWMNEEVFARLDAGVSNVEERGEVSDGEMAALVAGATLSLFPSVAEGYGFPPLESLALGTPVICANLPVYKEVLGDSVIYAAPFDRYEWQKVIRNQVQAGKPPREQIQAGFTPPSWDAHFKTVLSLI